MDSNKIKEENKIEVHRIQHEAWLNSVETQRMLKLLHDKRFDLLDTCVGQSVNIGVDPRLADCVRNTLIKCNAITEVIYILLKGDDK